MFENNIYSIIFTYKKKKFIVNFQDIINILKISFKEKNTKQMVFSTIWAIIYNLIDIKNTYLIIFFSEKDNRELIRFHYL